MNPLASCVKSFVAFSSQTLHCPFVPFGVFNSVDSFGQSPWRPTLKWRGSSTGQGRSSWGSVLANGARFIRPFGSGFIKTAGEDFPKDSINQAVLWHPVRPTDFKHLELYCLASHPTPHPPHIHPKHGRKKIGLPSKTCAETHRESHALMVPPFPKHSLQRPHPTIVSIWWSRQLSLASWGLWVCRWRQPHSARHLSHDSIKHKSGKCIWRTKSMSA